jgi:hypothetical protein
MQADANIRPTKTDVVGERYESYGKTMVRLAFGKECSYIENKRDPYNPLREFDIIVKRPADSASFLAGIEIKHREYGKYRLSCSGSEGPCEFSLVRDADCFRKHEQNGMELQRLLRNGKVDLSHMVSAYNYIVPAFIFMTNREIELENRETGQVLRRKWLHRMFDDGSHFFVCNPGNLTYIASAIMGLDDFDRVNHDDEYWQDEDGKTI